MIDKEKWYLQLRKQDGSVSKYKEKYFVDSTLEVKSTKSSRVGILGEEGIVLTSDQWKNISNLIENH